MYEHDALEVLLSKTKQNQAKQKGLEALEGKRENHTGGWDLISCGAPGSGAYNLNNIFMFFCCWPSLIFNIYFHFIVHFLLNSFVQFLLPPPMKLCFTEVIVTC